MRKIFRQLLIVTTATAALLSTGVHSVRAIDDPDIDYHTIETPHFYVHYYSGLEALAQRVARVAEEAHGLLAHRLAWAPQDKTHVNVTDRSDAANGAANVFGRNTITVYAYPPPPGDVLGHYNDWLRVLMYHEYVHILHLDTKLRAAELINSVIGKQINPNQVLPRWYIEGIAIYYESFLTDSGRLDSPLWQSWLRAAVLQDEFFALGTVSGQPAEWPLGNTPYLYGGFFVDYMVEQHGRDFISKFNHNYGSKLIPYAVNWAASKATGQTFRQMWLEWRASAHAEALATKTTVEARGRTAISEITKTGGNTKAPEMNPATGQITYLDTSLTRDAAFMSLDPTSGDSEPFLKIDGATGPHQWNREGDKLLFTRSTNHRNVYTYTDLFLYDRSTGDVTQVTEGARIHDFEVAPDGNRIAYVRAAPGTNELMVQRLDGFVPTGPKLEVISAETEAEGKTRWQQISSPTWGPHGRLLAFSWWRLATKQRDLWLSRIETDPKSLVATSPAQLTDSRAREVDPRFRSDALYFSSDKTGIFNIYRARLSSDFESDSRKLNFCGDRIATPNCFEPEKSSEVVVGAFSPLLTDERTYVTTYTSDGYELGRLELSTDAASGPTKKTPKRTSSAPSAQLSPNPEQSPAKPSDSVFRETDYRGSRWLAPLFLRPEFTLMTQGAGVGATIVGRDPVELHSYEIGGAWIANREATSESSGFSAQYSYKGWPIDMSLHTRLRRQRTTRQYFAESRFIPVFRNEYAGGFRLSYPIRSISESLTASVGSEFRYLDFASLPSTQPEPADLEPNRPESGRFTRSEFRIRYSNLERFPESISTAQGWSSYASVTVQDALKSERLDTTFMNYGASGYLPNPFVDRHVLHANLDGGVARSATSSSPGFVIGGYSPQKFLDSFLFGPPGNFGILRGYSPGVMSGSQFQIGSTEYRFPIYRADSGLSTLPVYARWVKGSVFADAGTATNGKLTDSNFRTSVGGEIHLETYIGYDIFDTLRLGYAHGFETGGLNQFYFRYGGGF